MLPEATKPVCCGARTAAKRLKEGSVHMAAHHASFLQHRYSRGSEHCCAMSWFVMSCYMG